MKRSEQLVENTWDLSMMYKPDHLDKDVDSLNGYVKELEVYKGKSMSKEDIVKALEITDEFYTLVDDMYTFFSHQQDTDFSNPDYVAIFNKFKGIYSDLAVKLSFLNPQISETDNAILQSIIDDSSLKQFHQTIQKIIDNKKRVLSVDEEKIISIFGYNAGAASNLYSAFTNSDLKFEDVKDKDNQSLPMNEAVYSNYIRSNDRDLRKNAYNCLFDTYGEYNQTLATNYIAKMKESFVGMKLRNYDSTLQRALEPNMIPLYVYSNLLDAVENNIQANYNYLDVRKKQMKLDDLHLYDVYVAMEADVEKKYPYEIGKQMCLESLTVLGDEYISLIKEAFDNRWIDVYENEGKRTGAYSGGSYRSVPYMLLNYTDELNDVFTLAHEIGHSMHSYYANKNNSYSDAGYTIFIAEVASTVNELIMINYLLEKEEDVSIKRYLLNYLLEQFRTTVVRQSMFARFELDSHKLVEENAPISNEVLNNLYYDINKKYFGDNIVLDENIKYEWSRIPHFYYNYYVYQYATCFSMALNIVDRILNKEEGIIEKYINFLKLGGSVYPIDALKTLDIDLSTPKVFEQAMVKYQETLDQYQALC